MAKEAEIKNRIIFKIKCTYLHALFAPKNSMQEGEMVCPFSTAWHTVVSFYMTLFVQCLEKVLAWHATRWCHILVTGCDIRHWKFRTGISVIEWKLKAWHNHTLFHIDKEEKIMLSIFIYLWGKWSNCDCLHKEQVYGAQPFVIFVNNSTTDGWRHDQCSGMCFHFCFVDLS